VVKNKVAPPFKEAQFDIMYAEGISKAGDLLDMAAQTEIVDKSGAWYSFDKERIGQGRENAKAFLKENPDVLARILEKVRDALGLGHKASQEGEGPPAEHVEKMVKGKR
jgi:recombination protein RecA